jgi:hypothetical protein
VLATLSIRVDSLDDCFLREAVSMLVIPGWAPVSALSSVCQAAPRKETAPIVAGLASLMSRSWLASRLA